MSSCKIKKDLVSEVGTNDLQHGGENQFSPLHCVLKQIPNS